MGLQILKSEFVQLALRHDKFTLVRFFGDSNSFTVEECKQNRHRYTKLSASMRYHVPGICMTSIKIDILRLQIVYNKECRIIKTIYLYRTSYITLQSMIQAEALPPGYIRYGGLKTHPIINSILPLYSNINRIQTFFTPIEINQLPSSWWTRAYV